MSTENDETFVPIAPEDIVPNDPVASVWRWCLRNNWTFVPDFSGGEPWVDTRCAWAMVKPNVSYKTARNSVLKGLERVNDLVRLSEVMAIQQSGAANNVIKTS